MLTTFAVLIMPVIVLLMAMVINVGHIVDSKIRLQIAADRAAYAGAAKEAHVMNKMAEMNFKIHERFEKLESDIGPNTNKDAPDLKDKVQNAKTDISNMANAMQDWNAKAMAWSYDVSSAILQSNYSDATQKRYGAGLDMLELLTEYEPGQHQKLKSDYNILEGGLIHEPKSHQDVLNIVLSYIVKNQNTPVRWESHVVAPLPAGILTSILNDYVPDLHVYAISAAQPHGGNIKACAFNKDCEKYKVSFVPVKGNYVH